METLTAFTAEEIEAYTFGDCWHLALEMHKQYDLPLGFVIAAKEKNPILDKDAWWVHVFNVLPNGDFVDIKGIHPREEMLKQWSAAVSDARLGCEPIPLTVTPKHEMSIAMLDGFERYYDTNTMRIANRVGKTHGISA